MSEARIPLRRWSTAGWLLAAWLVVQALLAGWFWSRLLPFAHGLGGDELQIANLAWFWRHGHLPYFADGAGRGVFNPYGPVFPWLCGALTLEGAFYPVARGLVVLALVVAAAAVAVGTGRGRWPWLAVALLPTLRPVFEFGCRARVDLPAAAAALVGFLLVTRGRTWQVVVGVLALVVATQTKASAIAAPLAAVAVLWPTDRRRAVAVAGGWAALCAVAVIALQQASGGGYLTNLLRPADDWSRAIDLAARPLGSAPFLLLALAAAWRRLDEGDRGSLRDARLYAWAAYAVAVVTGANWGSGWHYLIELHLALAWLAAASLALLARRGDRDGKRLVELLLLAHAIMAVPYLQTVAQHKLDQRREAAAGYARALPSLTRRVAAGQRLAVLDNPYAADALLSLGQPHLLDLIDLRPMPAERQQALLAETLTNGYVDAILCGPGLSEWHPGGATEL